MKAQISGIIPGSIASELKIAKGDFLLSVNGTELLDIIDYRFISADENLLLRIEKASGEIIEFDIEKDFDEDLGLTFMQDTFDGVRSCKNKCIFCFIDQMPKGMRKSLYLKDDDYRLSLLYGNFITLTNLTETDLARIKRMHISPLYISVHTTDKEHREKILGNKKAADLMAQLHELADAGIEMHTQLVVCPGINDGGELETSIRDLSALWPQVQSAAVVPVGVTKFQRNPALRPFSREEAIKLTDSIANLQKIFKKSIDSNFVFLADELYLAAGQELPAFEEYEGFPQIENGVGLMRYFLDSFEMAADELPLKLTQPQKTSLVTGRSGARMMLPVIERLNQIEGLTAELLVLDNLFFGQTVTVAGLLTGFDLLSGLAEWRKNQKDEVPEIMIPSTMLKYGENMFLDGLTISDVERELQVKIIVADPSGGDLINAIIKPLDRRHSAGKKRGKKFIVRKGGKK